MDLFKETQKLTDVAKILAEETARNLTKAIDEVTHTAIELTHASAETIDSMKATVAGLGASGAAVANALKNLPQTAEELAQEMPKIAMRLRNGAGLRVGDAPRSDADVMHLFNKIPGTSKLEASERQIRQFLADKHGSHIISRQQGGSNGADNIVWEVGTANLHRGAKVMTGGEQIYIRFYNAIDSILTSSTTIAKLGVAATGTAVLTQAVVTAAAYALDLYRGDITLEEFKEKVIEAAVSAGIAAPIFFLLLIMVLALFPELAIILSAPIVVAGFNGLFGISVALPIVQSIVRHIQAGGFGEEIAEGYDNLTVQAQDLLQPSTQAADQAAEAFS